jgi:hypothetical protein
MRPIWLIALLALLPVTAAQAEPRQDFTAILKDTEMIKNADHRLTIIIWMPEQYWRASLQSNDRLTDKAKDEFIEAIRPYTMLAVVDANVGIGAAFTFSSSDALRKVVTIEDGAGNLYVPLDSETVSGSMRNILQVMRPLLANAMGAMGSNVEIMLFPASGKGGGPIADPKQEGFFTVHVSDLSFRYRLPLGSLLPPMIDTRTGDTFPGNYHFNPFTGGKLSPAPASADSN